MSRKVCGAGVAATDTASMTQTYVVHVTRGLIKSNVKLRMQFFEFYYLVYVREVRMLHTYFVLCTVCFVLGASTLGC